MSSIKLTNVNVKFPISKAPLKRMVLDKVTRLGKKDNFSDGYYHALNNINLSLNKGDRLALIGKNGAGKTTLLKTLSGIYEPFSGSIKLEGNITPLTNVTAGMEMELSGRENLRIKGAFMNLSDEQIDQIEDDVIEFANLGKFIDLPVKNYSSGMIVRLAFAIATALPVDILLLDEWLSAGDIDFVEKSEQRMRKYVGSSSILVFASHSMDLLRSWCNKAVIVEKGVISDVYDDTSYAIEKYLKNTNT